MDILKLRYFLIVAKCQNMTKAAEILHVAQPAISQAIKKLDDELGVRLFDRVGRNIRLSDTGKLFYKQVEPLVQAIDDIPQILANEVGFENRTIKINVLAGHEMMINIIKEFNRMHPEANFQLSQSADHDSWDVRLSSVYDKAVANYEEKVLSEEILLAVPKDSHYSDMDCATMDDIKHAGFISLDKNRQFSVLSAGHCQAAGFEPVIVFEADSPEMIASLVGSGVGIAFWPQHSWGKINDERVKLVRLECGKCRRNLYFVRKDQMNRTELKDKFYEFTVNYLARFNN